jgi:ribonuclease P protein component
MRRSEDFRRTVRHGVRAGRRTVVVHALRVAPAVGAATTTSSSTGQRPDSLGAVATGPLVGFVVSKAVGSAVRRNRVRRRLRHLALPHLDEVTGPTLVVIRALPPAGSAGPELGTDLDAAWAAAMTRLATR